MTAPVVAALDVAAARAATDRLRLTLTDAHEQLIELYRGRAHEALGYGRGLAGWTAYLAAEFGELLSVVPTPDQLAAMVAAGMSQREAAAPFRVSVGTVNAAVKRKAPAKCAHPGTVTLPDGRRRCLYCGETLPAARPTYVQVAEVVAAAGARGLTILQAQRRLGWTYGATSGALSRAEARGLVTRPAHLDQRGGYRPYTAVTACPPR